MKVTTFGECLFHLSTIKGERLHNAQKLNFYLGGSELNIAANLKTLGVNSEWISKIPDGLTGELIQDKIQQLGLSLNHLESIKKGRPGFYLSESGATPRPDLVTGRYQSSLGDLTHFNFDWEKILDSSDYFHTSGITAGLSPALTDEVKKAMEVSKKKKIQVSYDFNYRKNIWSVEESVKRQQAILPLVDILFCSQKDLDLFFQDSTPAEIFKKTQLKMIVMSKRNSQETSYGIEVYTPQKKYSSQDYQITNLDRIGVGDSMAAGFLAGLIQSQDTQVASDWGALAGAMKYGIHGDMALLKKHEITEILSHGLKGVIR